MYRNITSHLRRYVEATDNDIQLLTSMLYRVNLAKRTFLLRPGTNVKHEYFVIRGCLKAYYLDGKGNPHILQFAIENWWVGDFDAFYNHVPSKLHIEAIEDSSLWAINHSDLQNLFVKRPIFERYFRLLVTSAFIAQRKRILSSLVNDTKDRYLDFCRTYPTIENRVPNYQIADYLGVSSESLSRIRRKLKS
jgi:CRP-like cAMP-binding protein